MQKRWLYSVPYCTESEQLHIYRGRDAPPAVLVAEIGRMQFIRCSGAYQSEAASEQVSA